MSIDIVGTESTPLRTRLLYDYYPRAFVKANSPMHLNPEEFVIKGLVQSVRHLPRSNTWLVKGLIAPTSMHIEIPLIPEESPLGILFDLPKGLSHSKASVTSTGSLETGIVNTVHILDKTMQIDSEQSARLRSMILVDTIGRRLAAATLDLTTKILTDEVDTFDPTFGLCSMGPINLEPDSHKVIATYTL